MEAVQAQIDLSIDREKNMTDCYMKQTRELLVILEKLAEAFKSTQAMVLELTNTDDEVAKADIANSDTPIVGIRSEKVVTVDAADEKSKKEAAILMEIGADVPHRKKARRS